jgi:hypothetical protein
MSPELFDPETFGLTNDCPTKESDYYALGMVMYEVLSGKAPFSQCSQPAVLLKVLDGERPSRPQGEEGEQFTDDIWGVLERCWKHYPRDRISARTVLLRLERQAPLQRPTFNADEDTETGSDTVASDSGMFSPFHPRPIFNLPRAITGLPTAHGTSKLPLPPRTANPKKGWLASIRKMFKVTSRKPREP